MIMTTARANRWMFTAALASAWGCGDSSEDASADASSSGGTSTGVVDDTGTASTGSVDGDTSSSTALDTSGGSGESGSDTTGGPPLEGPTHVLFIRTPHGVYEDQVWSGSGNGFVLGPVLEPLAPWSDALVLIDGIRNEILPPDGESITNIYGVSSASLLTGGMLGSTTGEPEFLFYLGGGPSLDVVLGAALNANTPAANVHLGVFATDQQYPTGVSYTAADQPLPPIDDPVFAFNLLFNGIADPLLDELQTELDQPVDGPGDVLDRQLAIAFAAIALDVSRVQLLSIDRGLPAILWNDLGAADDYHSLVANDEAAQIELIQTFWAERVAALLQRLQDTESERGTLLDDTLIVWLSAEGSPPAAYATDDIFAVVIDVGGSFATGRVVEVDADQADLAATIAQVMGAPLRHFGHPDLDATPIDDLLAR